MFLETPLSPTREQRLNEAVAEYLLEKEAGGDPARSDFLCRYPDLADDLATFFDDGDLFDELIGSTRPVVSSRSHWNVEVCPHCHAKLNVEATRADCPGCGARFRFDFSEDTERLKRRLGRFDLICIAGRGAFATVYKAWDPEMERTVAIKVPREGAFIRHTDVERFLREARVAIGLHHPHIVRVYEVGRDQGVPFLVSEFVTGPTLADQIRHHRPSECRAAELIASIAEALDFAHRRGIIHRDIKPSNILLRWHDAPVLADFGLARQGDEDTTITLDGEVLGTLSYLSPEQDRGHSHIVDGRTDIYSLGVVFYQLLTGQLPFVGNIKMVLQQILNEEPRRPQLLNDMLPQDLEIICLKCLRKDPSRRYQTAADLASDLHRFLRGQPIKARPMSRWEKLESWARRNPLLMCGSILTLVLLLAITVVSVSWASDATQKSITINKVLTTSKLIAAETELDRGIAEAERGDIASGLLWMARSLESAPDESEELLWTIRTNLNAWQKQLVQLTNCHIAPPGRVVGFSKDGRFAWFLDRNMTTIGCWDIEKGQVFGQLIQNNESVVSFAISPKQQEIACGLRRRQIKIWNTQSQKLERTIESQNDSVAVAYSSDGRLLIAGTSKPDGADRRGQVCLEMMDNDHPTPLGIRMSPVSPALLASDGVGQIFFSTRTRGASIYRWDASTRQALNVPIQLPTPINSLAVSPDGQQVLTGGDDRMARLWDAKSGRLLADLHHRTPISAVAFDSEQRGLSTASEADAVRLWSCPALSESFLPQPLPEKIRALAVSPDGSLVASGADDGRVVLWRILPDQWEPVGQPLLHSRPIHSITFSADGKILAVLPFFFAASQNGGAHIWNTAAGFTGELLVHKAHIHQIAISPDSRLAATAGDDHDVWIWDLQSCKPVLAQPIHHTETVLTVTFSRDGRSLITAGGDGLVRQWDVENGRSLGEPFPHDDAVRVVCFHPQDNDLLLTASDDGSARLWNVRTRQLQAKLNHGGPIWVARFTPDGRSVLTGGRDGKVRVWELATGKEIERTLQHSAWVRALAISPSNRWAVTASDDETARLWSIRLGRPIGPSVHHNDRSCTIVDPNDRWFITVGENGQVRWQPAPTEWTMPVALVNRWIQVKTGAELSARGELTPLAPLTWRQRALDMQAKPTVPQ